jgi:hypothetical protein
VPTLSKPAVRQQANLFFPSTVWEKACIAIVESFAARANFPPLGSLRAALVAQHSILVLCVILRSAATKNLLLAQKKRKADASLRSA